MGDAADVDAVFFSDVIMVDGVAVNCTGYRNIVSNDSDEEAIGCPRPRRNRGDYVGCSGFEPPQLGSADIDDESMGIYGLEFGYQIYTPAELSEDDSADALKGLERRMLDLMSAEMGFEGCSVGTATTAVGDRDRRVMRKPLRRRKLLRSNEDGESGEREGLIGALLPRDERALEGGGVDGNDFGMAGMSSSPKDVPVLMTGGG